jgi:hypothetical protein
MFGLDLVAIHFLAAEIAVKRVQIEAVFAGNAGERFPGVRAEFIRRPGLARLISGGNEPAAERAAEVFEAADIIALPAVEGDGDFGELGQHAIDVHADFGIAVLGETKRFLYVLF